MQVTHAPTSAMCSSTNVMDMAATTQTTIAGVLFHMVPGISTDERHDVQHLLGGERWVLSTRESCNYDGRLINDTC